MPSYVVEWLMTLAAPVVTALLSWLTAEAIRWLRAHVAHTQTADALARAVVAVGAAVGEVSQG